MSLVSIYQVTVFTFDSGLCKQLLGKHPLPSRIPLCHLRIIRIVIQPNSQSLQPPREKELIQNQSQVSNGKHVAPIHDPMPRIFTSKKKANEMSAEPNELGFHLPKCCWWGLITRDCMHNCNLGTMCLIRNATNDPSGKALCHGFNINFAERSDGCQFVSATPSFSWINGYTDACSLSSKNHK